MHDDFEMAYWNIKEGGAEDEFFKPTYNCGPTTRRGRAKLHFFVFTGVFLIMLALIAVAIYYFIKERP